VEDPQVRAAQSESDQRERPTVRQMYGTADRGGDQGPDGTIVRLCVHAVYRPGGTADQRPVRCE